MAKQFPDPPYQNETQQEITKLLETIAKADRARNQALPALSAEATKLLAEQIRHLLRKDLH